MSELKTKPTDESVQAFIDSQPDGRREDCAALLDIYTRATGSTPRMWGQIVGFGDYHYKYASGREGDWFVAGFASRKQALTLYLSQYLIQHEARLARLGKHKTGKGCLYINRLSDVDLTELEALIVEASQAKQAE